MAATVRKRVHSALTASGTALDAVQRLGGDDHLANHVAA